MLSKIRRTIASLQSNTSGNAALLVAIGMPALMGSSGLAVDVAQWYMWKQELQYAVDQAALGGAWARSSTASRDTYVARARQALPVHPATAPGAPTTPSVTLGNYNGGSNNAVLVTASATRSLPFSSMITGRATTVSVSARATFSVAATYNACILAVNPVENRSAVFGNAITGGSNCGVGALSVSDQAIFETGDSEVALGDIISAGGVEDSFSNNGTIHEYVSGLSDPYAGLTTPSSAGSPSRTYSCPTASSGTTTWTADRTVRTVTTYLYKRGNPVASATVITRTSSDPGYMAPSDITSGPTNETLSSAPTAGTTTVGPTTGSYSNVAGSGTNRIWRAAVTTTTTTISNVVGPTTTGASDGIARPLPGIYSSISINCPTEFQSGIYFISGNIDFGNNRTVTGSDVMFVMTGSSGNVRINSQSDVTLTGISASTLQNTYGYSASDANKWKNMLFFDKNNTSDFDINGTADIDFNGILYMPSGEVNINGRKTPRGRCIMVMSDTFWITGSANLTNFCAPDGGAGMQIGDQTATVRLIA